jgi:hypothetical protein
MNIRNLSVKSLLRAAKIRSRIDKLEVQLARMLNGGTKDNGGATQSAAPKRRRKRRKMSAAARAKISAAQRKRWKAQKAAN